LKGSKYWKFNGRRIHKRKDGKDPSVEYLKQKLTEISKTWRFTGLQGSQPL
jgi:hypothetical protein